ncbi:MAG: ABC transporter permease [Thermotogae bacterium]|uniref:ABC transporter permease n=1 Tax=Mesotoga sp. TaxID=2053577 RepID=UPI003378F95F|nr:ABC transporter permease [Thermotogota bacterium]
MRRSTDSNSVLRKLFGKSEFYLLLVIIVVSLFFTVLKPSFLTFTNLYGMVESNSFLAIMAAGVLVVLISGGIDISFTAIATVAQYVMATIVIHWGGNMFLAFAIGAVVGIALGFVNALLIYFLKTPPIIVTIATMNLFYGLLIFISGGTWIYGFPMWFMERNLVRFGDNPGITIPILVLVLSFILTWLILKYTALGRNIYAVGGNQEAARRVGISVLKTQLFVYCYMGFLAGIASTVQANMMLTVAPNALMGRELEVLAAVVLGGASLAGGTGSILGTVLGFGLIVIVQNGLTLLGISSYWHKVFIGAIIVVSVGITAYQRKVRERKGAIINVEE